MSEAAIPVLEKEEEEEEFPSPPRDFDLSAFESDGIDPSQILDFSMDSDGNPRDNPESKNDRNLKSSVKTKPKGTNEANVVKRDKKDQQIRREEADVRPKKQSATDLDEPRKQPKQSRDQATQRKPLVESQKDNLKSMDLGTKLECAKRKLRENYEQDENAKRQKTIQVRDTIPEQSRAKTKELKKDQQIKREEADLDERRKQPNQSRDQTVQTTQRKPLVESQKDNLKSMDLDAKLESAKRRLREDYEQHENARRNRSIQVLDTIPEQSKAKRQQFKRPSRRR